MPNPKLSEKFRGKPFGEISKEIESKYKDRFDPISRRGLMAEMGSLKEEQEFQKAKQEVRQQLQQQIQQAQQPQEQMQQGQMPEQQMNPMSPEIQASNMGVSPEMPMQQPQGHQASQSYNEQFAYGGKMNYVDGGEFDLNNPFGLNNFARFNQSTANNPILNLSPEQIAGRQAFSDNYSTTANKPTGQTSGNQNPFNSVRVQPMAPVEGPQRGAGNMPGINMTQGLSNSKNNFNANIASLKNNNTAGGDNNNFQVQGNDPMRYAPLAANIYGILAARRAPSTQSTLSKMGVRSQVDESLANGVTPRQTQFGNVDMSQIERGINDRARSFTGANINMSGGQSGQFLANELGSQANVMNAIGQARMGAQQQDRQTQAMNAQELGRIDGFRQQQGMQRAGIQQTNIGIGMQMADLDARNEGAFNTNRMAQISGLTQNLGNIGKESDQMKMIANSMGYNSFGDYVANLDPAERQNIIQTILGARNT